MNGKGLLLQNISLAIQKAFLKALHTSHLYYSDSYRSLHYPSNYQPQHVSGMHPQYVMEYGSMATRCSTPGHSTSFLGLLFFMSWLYYLFMYSLNPYAHLHI